MGRPLPLTTFFVLAVFAAAGGIVWLAYGDTGKVVGEPPLVRASTEPLKQSPDDPGGRRVADLGGIGELLEDLPEGDAEERLMPTPEQPLSPEEAATAGLGRGGAPDGLGPSLEEQDRARAALEALVTGLRSEDNTPSGVGGPASARLPSPTRDGQEVAVEPPPGLEIALQRNEPEPRENPDVSSSGVQLAAVNEGVVNGEDVRFQGAAGGRFRVQLAAVREEDDAKRAWTLFQERLGPAIADLEPFFEKAETSNGIFYRVQIGPFAERNIADSLCLELKKQDASCFVVSR